jgi:AraC-like DNA-binding protein/quercetin dioxygenase-like cupin family protein
MPFLEPKHDDLEIDSQGHFHPDDVPRAIAAVGGRLFTKGMEVAVHQHRKAQLVLTLRGIVRCEADDGVWIVPPQCAVWIPGGVLHRVTLAGDVEVYCLFVEPNAAPTLPQHCCTLAVSPLLQHLLLHVARVPELYDVDGADGRIATVLLDQLSAAPAENLNFPMPVDARLRKIAAAMMADPADRATIDDWGRRVAAAPRTLTRALQRETGMSFGRWRQQLHIIIALQRLAEGASVQTVALDLGYESASAFVTMFRKALGKPPGRYMAKHQIKARSRSAPPGTHSAD